MAQQYYKIDLQATDFPMLSEQQTRTIIGSNAREAAGASGYDENRPRLSYCENVMPTKYGLQSIGFLDVVPAITGIDGVVDETRTMWGSNRGKVILTWDSNGNTYAMLPETSVWIAIPDPTPAFSGVDFFVNNLTVGTVNGKSYLAYNEIGVYEFNEDTNTLDTVTFIGIDANNILGITSYAGYLITFTRTAIAWSSTINPLDFVPSAVTGAGGGNIDGVDGLIIIVVPNALGIIIYGKHNAVAGTYTGNVRYPFKFREIHASRGSTSLDKVTYEANMREQYIFADAGLQSVSSQEAKAILPAANDFLTGKRIESYNTTTRVMTVKDINPNISMVKKIRIIASRYLVISYGEVGIQYAMIYDIALDKLGKIKLDHVNTFEYIAPSPIGDRARNAIGFLLADGSVKTLNFTVGAASEGVMMLGKLQYTRTRMITLLETEIENVEQASTLSVSTNASLDGKNYTNIEGTEALDTEGLRVHNFLSTAKNHTIVLIGEFDAATVQVTYTINGKR